jgi:hypothetical protein
VARPILGGLHHEEVFAEYRRLSKADILLQIIQEIIWNAQFQFSGDTAGLDVFHREPVPKESPLLSLDNVICTPHSAAIYPMGSNIFYDVQRTSENVLSVMRGKGLIHGRLVGVSASSECALPGGVEE